MTSAVSNDVDDRVVLGDGVERTALTLPIGVIVVLVEHLAAVEARPARAEQ
jgi:hypothetical protein